MIHLLIPNTRLYCDIVFVGFHVTMKMKRAAVSLVESSTENVKRRKSFSKRHSKFISVLTHYAVLCYNLCLYNAVLFTESVDSGARPARHRLESSSSGKKLAVSVYTSSPQPSKKQKGNKKKS